MKILGRKLIAKQVIDNPDYEELRALARHGETTTVFGSPAYITNVRNRSAKFTQIADINQPEYTQTVDEVMDYLKDKVLIQTDRTMCQNPEFQLACRLYVTKEYARIPLIWGQTLFPPKGREPDLVTITIPEWKERRVLVFPEQGLTIILGTDYKGENKKSMLRQTMYRAKQHGWLGLHAGSKILRVKRRGKLTDVGFLFFGLSGTGKTSLSCHSHWLRGEERVVIRQDDVVLLRQDGSVLGTEDSFYIKTEGLNVDEQPVLYAATISPRAILENVWVDKETGRVDFYDSTLTSNGRAMVKRSDIAYTDDSIDLPYADCIVFITRRNDIVPPIARLNPEQAAAAFMLGESIETSAGDPSQAGKSKRVVGTNPFIIGPEHEEGNRFLDILRANPRIQCFVMNTGRVGMRPDFEGDKITLKVSAKLVEMIAKDEIKWEVDPYWGYEVPTKVPGLDMGRFDPRKYYQQSRYNELCDKLRQERREWLSRFPELYPEIIEAV
jgi:phosphoenolpyruvate carboxykinase (ATP)